MTKLKKKSHSYDNLERNRFNFTIILISNIKNNQFTAKNYLQIQFQIFDFVDHFASEKKTIEKLNF